MTIRVTSMSFWKNQILNPCIRTIVTCLLSSVAMIGSAAEPERPIRVGMIGLDTSHVIAFTKLLNDPRATGDLADVSIVAGFPGGNPNFPLSRDRVEGFTRQLREMDIEIVGSVKELLRKVDAVMLESVDGSQHLEQARLVFAAGKPLFIDKPLAASLKDAVAIYELGRKHDTPWFAASSSRFTPGYLELRENEQLGKVLGCDAYSQSRAAPHHPDLFWYGVHGVDLLYTVMGRGCQNVTAVQTEYSESVRGVWSGGRVGTYRSIREHTGKTGLGVTVFGTKGIVHHNQYYDYKPLVAEVARFFKTGKPPVSSEETLEVFAFMEAAEESKRQGGAVVKISEVMKNARQSPTTLGLTPDELAKGYVSLFDGRTLNGWRPAPDFLVKNGLLVCTGKAEDGNETDKLLTENTYRNFRLRFDYRLHQCANNGVALRCPLKGKASTQGMEVQIIDADDPCYQGLSRDAYHGAWLNGSLHDLAPAKQGAGKPAGKWNAMDVLCEGRKVVVTLNGTKILDANLETLADNRPQHPGLKRSEGYVGFIANGRRSEFRNIRILELK